jgi:ADP-L-glycero-D-manno-heptose 6-epimerase
MRSVVHKAYGQIAENGKVKLFKSANPNYKDGEQLRDFVYIKDAVEMTLFFLDNTLGGIFNVGTGKARSWNALVSAIFNALKIPINIEYIDMPESLAKKYQYFTEAKLDKIKNAGYAKKISSLEEGITDYVQNYLMNEKYLGM